MALSKKDARQVTSDRCKKKLFVGGLSQKTTEGKRHFFFDDLQSDIISAKCPWLNRVVT